MATAKKSKKSVKKSKKASKLNPYQRLEQATTPEELLAGLPALDAEHGEQVRVLGKRIIALVEKYKVHPVVVLDTLQLLLSAGIGSALGERHQQIWDAYVHRYHDESKMLSILEALGGINLEEVEISDETPATDSTPEPQEGDFKG